MSPRFWPIVRHAALPLVALASILSCQNTTVIEDDPPSGPGKHYVHFLVTDTPAIPDSIWFRTPMDSGTWAFSVNPAQVGRYVNFLPVINQLGERDSMSIHAFRLGMHTGIYNVKEVNYMELGAQHLVRTGADSLAVKLLRVYDSLRKADSVTYQSADTTLAGRTKLFQQVAAKLVFEGHPATSAYLRVAPVGLDTASVTRQILTLAAKSGLTLGEVVRQWNLRMDYATARQALASMALDSQSVNPFRIETALALDSLHRGEPAVGLRGKISGAKGIQSVSFSVTNDSGDRTDRFVLADAPDLKNEPKDLDFAGHPTFAPRANALVGSYTLRILVKDALGNEQSYTTPFQVGAELDHTGPSLTVLSPTSAVVRDYNDSQLVVKVEAKDPSGVKSVVIDGNAADKGSDGIWLDTLLVPVRDSSQLVKIEAKDVFGNASSTQIQIRRNEAPKPTAPRLSLVSPANNTLVPFESKGVWVEWKAETDFGGIDSVTIDGKTAKPEGGVWRLWVDLVADGKLVNLPVRAFSSVKLSATEFVSVGRSPDLAGPLVEWTDPPQDRRVAYDVKQLDLTVLVVDSSGVDSVRIGGSKVNPASGVWKANVLLAGPGELTRIRVEAWDHAGNRTDTQFVVARDGVPSSLPPSIRWMNPTLRTGTLIPFADSGIWIRVALTDLSGMDSGSVKIEGQLAKPINDSVWERWVGLPPNGIPQAITLEAKNKRGVAISDFAMLTRDLDTVKAVGISDTNGKLRSGSFWVKLSCPTPGAIIRYTLDGTDPTTSSPKFADSIKIDTTITLKVRAYAKDRVDGPVVTQKYQLAVPVGVSTSGRGALVLMSDKSLWGIGYVATMDSSRGNDPVSLIPILLDSNVVQMAHGHGFSLWVKNDGTLWGIGKNSSHELGDGTTDFRPLPVLIARGIRKAAAEIVGGYIQMNGCFKSVRSNHSSDSGSGKGYYEMVACGVAEAFPREYQNWYLTINGEFWRVGKVAWNDVADSLPLRIADSVRLSAQFLGSGAVVRNNGDVIWFGKRNILVEEYSFNDSPPFKTNAFDGKGRILKLAIGSGHAVALFGSGELWGIGANYDYELGLSDRTKISTLTKIAQGVIEVAAGGQQTYWVTQAGELYRTGRRIDKYPSGGIGGVSLPPERLKF